MALYGLLRDDEDCPPGWVDLDSTRPGGPPSSRALGDAMPTTGDLLRSIAYRCREDHSAALFLVGYFCASLPPDKLADLVEALDELRRPPTDDHLVLFRERWGTGGRAT